MTIPEIQDELLRLEYPYLLPDHDPDIERYYYLRNTSRSKDALNLYQNRLKPRYPNDEFRTALLRCYRSRSPLFKQLLARAYRFLGEQALERVRRIIAYIAEKAAAYDSKDVYSTIRAAEDILRFLPPDRYEAAMGIDRFIRYAEAMNFELKSMTRAGELIRSYLSDSLSVVQSERRRRENLQRQMIEEEQRRLTDADWESYRLQKEHGKNSLIDFSSITFSPADLARIEIPKRFTRIEDQTLAYCVKYWNLVNDSAFERILFLYSRKYGTKNYDVYMAIRRGLHNKSKDDEILNSVMSALITGYYYSVQGDQYLQRNWNAIKAVLTQPKTVQAPQSLSSKAVVQVPAAASAQKKMPKKKKAAAKKRDAAKKKTVIKKQAAPKEKVAAPVKNKKPVPAKKPSARIFRPRSVVSKPRETLKPGGSVSDRLRELSGHSYDVFQDRFLAKVRGAIRKILSVGKGRFFVPPEDAENLIYHFLKTHYADPYMNWENSEERGALQALGFNLDSLIPVIDECYRRL
jgi:hypothetical protein